MITVFTIFVLVAVLVEVVAAMAQIKSENWTTLLLGLATFNLGIAFFSTLFFIWKKICRKKDNGRPETNEVKMKDMVNSHLLSYEKEQAI